MKIIIIAIAFNGELEKNYRSKERYIIADKKKLSLKSYFILFLMSCTFRTFEI
jgi:hypothetical protein